METLTNARVVTPDGIHEPGWLQVDGTRIAALGRGAPPSSHTGRRDLGGHWLVPGFIDLHLHGGGGATMTAGDPDEVRQVAAFHRRHGTTRAMASLVTAPLDELVAAARGIAQAVADSDGRIMGCHLEGPFLNHARRGVHDARHLRDPDPAALDEVLAAADGTVRVVTLAPELPGGVGLVHRIVAAGAVAAVGHSAATYAQTVEAVAAGARLATHLYNAMPPAHHREPGPVVALLESRQVVCELINDGSHLHGATVRLVFAVAGSHRVALITDAIAAAGMPDGDYTLGTVDVTVRGGTARVAGTSTLAGSTLTMAEAVRRTVQDSGVPLADAVTAAAATPARLLGLDDRAGTLAPGKDADLVVLDTDLRPAMVMVAGRWIDEPVAPPET